MIIYPDGGPDAELATHETLPPVTPFPNLRAAGGELATALESYRKQDNVLVLAMALGGVLVGHEVAIRLGLPFDLVILRRLLAPADLGSPVCAVNVAGNLEIVGELPPRPVVPLTGVDFFIADALADLARREKVCRGGRPPCDIAGKIVLLVDCGMRTGETMRAAIRALRARQPAKIVVAQPVASVGVSAIVSAEADDLVCLGQPRPFGNVGVWYKDFTRPGDDEISDLLREAMM